MSGEFDNLLMDMRNYLSGSINAKDLVSKIDAFIYNDCASKLPYEMHNHIQDLQNETAFYVSDELECKKEGFYINEDNLKSLIESFLKKVFF